MKDELSRLSELAKSLEQQTAVSRRYGVFIKEGLNALEQGRTDDGLAFELQIVEAFLDVSNRCEDAELIRHLSGLLSDGARKGEVNASMECERSPQRLV